MHFFLSLIVFFSLSIFVVGTYIIWPNRWNIIAHLQLGFVFTAYFVPIFFVDILKYFPYQIVFKYSMILFLGAIAYVIGLIMGHSVPFIKATTLPYSFYVLPKEELVDYVSTRVKWIMITALIGITISFIVMGFVPMFAENPLEAKFFRGQYHEPYSKVSILFRFSYFIIVNLISITFTVWYLTKRKIFFLLGCLGVIAIILTLTREPALVGLLIFLGLLAARRKTLIFLYIASIICFYFLGSSMYYILGKWFSIESLKAVYASNQNIWWVVASGSPDISDQLKFFSAFLNNVEFTYGKTFVGGLVPGNYKWNPHVWTLAVVNGSSDISNVISGGLRLPVALYGYTAFSWIGVFFVPFLSGFILGNITKMVKKFVNENDMMKSALAILFYTTIGIPISEFYKSSMYMIPTIAAVVFLIYSISFSKYKYKRAKV